MAELVRGTTNMPQLVWLFFIGVIVGIGLGLGFALYSDTCC
jgi:uncharacterized protein involved in exopolysaccharide biosynthesis